MSEVIIAAQPARRRHPVPPVESTQRIPKIRAHIPSHRVGEPGKVPIHALYPGLVPARTPGFFARLVGAR